MPDADYTGLLLIVDRSSAIESFRDEMASGLTETLRAQQEEDRRVSVDVVLFDSEIETAHVFADPAEAQLTLEPRGEGRALFDAIGSAVTEYGQRLADLSEEQRPSRVIVVIAAAGGDDSSSEHSSDSIRQMIADQQWTYAWSFVFAGAGDDAVAAANELEVRPGNTLTFSTGPEAVTAANAAVRGWIGSRKAGAGEPVFSDEDRQNSVRESSERESSPAVESTESAPEELSSEEAAQDELTLGEPVSADEPALTEQAPEESAAAEEPSTDSEVEQPASDEPAVLDDPMTEAVSEESAPEEPASEEQPAAVEPQAEAPAKPAKSASSAAKTKLLQVDHLEVGFAVTQNFKRKGQRALKVAEVGVDDAGKRFARLSGRTGDDLTVTNDDLASLDIKVPVGSPMDEGQQHLKN